MDYIDVPVFDGDPDDYQGDEVVEHIWPDGQVDLLPVCCPAVEPAGERVQGHEIPTASLFSLAGMWGMVGGVTSASLRRIRGDVYAELYDREEPNEDEDEGFKAGIVRGPVSEVIDSWLSGAPVNEFIWDLDWADVALAYLHGLDQLASAVLFDESLPASLFPTVRPSEETTDWFVPLTLRAGNEQLDQLGVSVGVMV